MKEGISEKALFSISLNKNENKKTRFFDPTSIVHGESTLKPEYVLETRVNERRSSQKERIRFQKKKILR
ncbi:hypothetical protein DLM75_21640 [Leptospira stimsonii]|uniref:Uncharacterized protein n=1 Tax=Leptospira stimsonii TaxID=2202203 RepID=A0A396YUT0_9LEPT|nr:hypothetical protein DLM75_21640 [Leptospira stimsonii]